MPELIKPIENDHSAEWHAVRFPAFANAKAAIGEPTPHMRVVSWLCEGQPEQERVWRAGCYLAAYSVLSGEAIWREWPWGRFLMEPGKFPGWLKENWAGIHTRKPRRCVRTPEAFTRCINGYADWAVEEFPRLQHSTFNSPREEYDAWWASATSIPFFGRYVAIRLLELFRRWGYMKADLYDIRAVGAHSPIRCLMLLRPDAVPELSTGRAEVVDSVAQAVKRTIAADMSYFTFATLLCEYRASYEDRHDYAGLQHDEELSYLNSRYGDYWRGRGCESDILKARAAIDPAECLGELQGWTGIRPEPPRWLRDDGIVWSDLSFDYKTSVLVGRPIMRGWDQ